MSSTAIDKVETAAEKVVDRVAEGKVDSTDSNLRCKTAALDYERPSCPLT